jgi:hypothetical protein
MASIDPLIMLCLWLPISYVSAFAHEVGHAVMGHAVGFLVSSFGLGMAHPFAIYFRGRTRIYFCRTNPLQGIAFCHPPVLFPPRKMMVPFLAGGIIANSLLAVGSLALWRWLQWGGSVWLTGASVNALLAIANVVPYQFRVGKATLRTDGNQILQVLRDRVISRPAPAIIQTLSSLRSLWASVGDHATLRAYIVGAAWAYSEIEDFERGEALLVELDSLVASEIPTIQASEALIRAIIFGRTGRLDEAAVALASAEALFRSIADDGGMLLVAMERSWPRLLKRDAEAVAGELRTLTSHPLVTGSPLIQNQVHAFCVQVQAASSDVVETEKALAQYEATRCRYSSSALDIQVYQTVARLRSQNEDFVRAELAYRKCFEAINDLAGLWPDVDERRRFLQRKTAFFAEARQCYEVLNRAEEAERLIQAILSPEQIQQRLDDARRLRNRRLFRVGLWIMLVDVACAAGMTGLEAFLRLGPSHLLFQGSVLFVVFTVVAVVLLLSYFAIAWFVPALRRIGGTVIVAIACSPWITLLICAFAF